MTNWTDIHKGFRNWQKHWEQANITKEEAQGWIEIGFTPHWLDLYKVKKWKNLSFSATETKPWLEVGLDKEKDWEFASWLRINNYTPELVKNNLEQLGSDYNPYWLTKHYSNHNIKELDINRKNLKGELNLSQYQQLEKLDCRFNKLTNIILPTSLKKLNLSWNNFNQDLSFLIPYTNLEELNLRNNNFTGSLDYLSGMKQLKSLEISNTDINEVQIDKLPRSLKKIEYSIEYRPNCKLTAIIPLLEPVKYGWCGKCQQPKTSEKWCQPCAEKEWKQLTGQELINKFIEQQQSRETYKYNKLKWIPYEEFANIEYLTEGGFSKIYKTQWKTKDYKGDDEGRKVVLKSLNNSQNITWEFLTEIANTKLVGSNSVVNCHGISQDPTTKNYLMVMEYMNDGNLRQYLQNKDNKLSLEDKFRKLQYIVKGLNAIHRQNLVHRDFHSGNILNSYSSTYITDLGLSCPVNYQKEEGKIFGVLPYVAPEVLQGKPYTKKADIYSLGIIMYESLTNSYPYLEMDNTELTLKICNGYRPNLDKVPLPQLLKDLIKRCWDSNPDKRPKTEELDNIINNWIWEINNQWKNTPFYQQYQEIAAEYNILSKKSYKIHENSITTSKMIDTKTITQQLEIYSQSLAMDFTNLNLENNQDWTTISPNLTDELIQQWQEQNFTLEQCRDWINIGLKPTDAEFCVWLRDIVKITSEQVLNENSEKELRDLFQEYKKQQQFQIEQSPKS